MYKGYLDRSDIDRFERDGAFVLSMPIGKERVSAIQNLCGRIRKTEPKAFEAAAEWMSKELPKVPLKAFGEAEAKSFSQWWRLRLGLERESELDKILERSKSVVSWPYSGEAIGIYMALQSEVYGLMGDSVVDKRLTTEKAKKMFGFLSEYVEVTEEKLIWLKGSKTDFVCYVMEAQAYLGVGGSEWSMFEKSFVIHDNAFKPTRLQSYSRKGVVNKKIEDNEGYCGEIKMLFTRNSK